MINPHSRSEEVRIRPGIEPGSVQNKIALNRNGGRVPQKRGPTDPHWSLCPIMGRMTNLPPRQSKRHQQSKNPRNPLGPFLRIRLLDNVLFPCITQSFDTKRRSPRRSPHPPMRPPRIPTHEHDEAPEGQIYGQNIEASDVPRVDLTRINGRQEQQRQLTARQHRRRRQQSGGQEQKGHEIAVAVWARDDVTGYVLIGLRELGERVHAGGRCYAIDWG